MHIPTLTYGLELEKTFSGINGEPHAVGAAYFENLQQQKQARGESATIKTLGGTSVGVATRYGEEGLDNSFGLGESATGPIAETDGGLNKLASVVHQELQDVLNALAAEDATVVNMSNHPLTPVTKNVYDQTVVPKPVYPYMREVRGWNHIAGINGKSQNSPSVGISAEHAVQAVNIAMGLGAGMIALYANSPFEEGKIAGASESRMALWSSMFDNATFAGDRRLYKLPEHPFDTLRDYFTWMFGPDTSMYFVATAPDGSEIKSEKGEVDLVHIDGDPSLLEYMKGESWTGKAFGKKDSVTVKPTMGHFALHQFTQFTGARIRYAFTDEPFEVADFNEAMSGAGNEVDTLFARHGAYFYIEGRDAGANFADQELLDMPNGAAIARSVIMSPAAIQTGLIRNADEASALIAKYGWANLAGLRDEAVIHGLNAACGDVTAQQLCKDILDIAARGLREDEQWMLAYPQFVLATGLTGAARALDAFNRHNGTTAAKIKQIAKERAIVLPSSTV